MTQQWTRHWEPEQKIPYATFENQWVGYDDTESIALKVQYLISENLGGAMVWSIETDDFRGICGQQKNPLLSVINSVLNKGVTIAPPSNTPATTNKPSNLTTKKPTITTAAPTQTPPSGLYECTVDGTFPDPLDCTKFYVCDNGRFFPFDCPDKLRFDVRIEACNWKELVDC